jgi:hypothetical protein
MSAASDEFNRGLTPVMQEQFAAIAQTIRHAIEQANDAYQEAEGGSDTELRAGELARELEEALGTAAWTPPAEEGDV